MARLVVAACSGELTRAPNVVGQLWVAVSVSRANDGAPVTGLGAGNFRIAAQLGAFGDFSIDQVGEWSWEPGDTEAAGCYLLRLGWRYDPDLLDPRPATGDPFVPGMSYVLGVQARTFDNHHPPRVVDQGQTIVRVISRGA
jgi:hypothetical protein